MKRQSAVRAFKFEAENGLYWLEARRRLYSRLALQYGALRVNRRWPKLMQLAGDYFKEVRHD